MDPDQAIPVRRSRRVAYANKWITVYEDELTYADDRPGLYGIVDKADFALVIPRRDGRLCLIRQYRYTVGAWRWEFPQGSVDRSGDPVPMAQVAAQELREEAGLVAAELVPLGLFHELYGLCPSRCHVFLADVGESGIPEPEDTEILDEPAWVTPSEFWQLVRQGEISDGPSIAAMGLLRQAADDR